MSREYAPGGEVGSEHYNPETVRELIETATRWFDTNDYITQTGEAVDAPIREQGVYQIDSVEPRPFVNGDPVDLERRYLKDGRLVLFVAGLGRSLDLNQAGVFWGLKVNVDEGKVMESTVLSSKTIGPRRGEPLQKRPLKGFELATLTAGLKKSH